MFLVGSSASLLADLAPAPRRKAPLCNMFPCHGLDLQCLAKPAEGCREIYQLGDFCRSYANCEVIKGKCQLPRSPKFEACKTCVKACKKIDEVCEKTCRKKMSAP